MAKFPGKIGKLATSTPVCEEDLMGLCPGSSEELNKLPGLPARLAQYAPRAQ